MRKRRKKSTFSRLRDYKSRDWRRSLSHIPNEFLKIKLACIIVWDFYDEENKKCPAYLKKLSASYNIIDPDFFHIQFTKEELYLHLKIIGYPEKLSRRRSDYRYD